MKTYYVDPDTGSDSNTETQAQTAGTPWKTIGKAAGTCDNTATPDGSGVACYIKISNGKTVDAGWLLDLNRANPNTVVFQPVTNPGNSLQGWTLSGSGGSGAVIRPQGALTNRWRFENAHIAPTSGTFCAEWDYGFSNVEFRDCFFDNAAYHLFYWGDAGNVSGLTFRRCSFTGYSFNIGQNGVGVSLRTHTISNLLFDSCTNSGPGFPYIAGPGNNIRVKGGTWSGTAGGAPVFAIGNYNSTKSARNTNVIVEDATFTGGNGNHVLFVDADGAIVRRNTIHTGSTGTAGYGLVTKWGFGYQVYGNTVYCESPSGTGIVVKGVTEASYLANRLYASGAAAKCIEVYTGDDAKLPRNIAVRQNRFITSGAARAISVVNADPTGYLAFDENDYQLAGTGQSWIFEGTIAADTIANIRAAWLNSATSIAGGWTENELNRYQGRRPRIGCALAG